MHSFQLFPQVSTVYNSLSTPVPTVSNSTRKPFAARPGFQTTRQPVFNMCSARNLCSRSTPLQIQNIWKKCTQFFLKSNMCKFGSFNENFRYKRVFRFSQMPSYPLLFSCYTYSSLCWWVSGTFEFWTQRVSWDPSDIWSEWCVDKNTKRQKVKKTPWQPHLHLLRKSYAIPCNPMQKLHRFLRFWSIPQKTDTNNHM